MEQITKSEASKRLKVSPAMVTKYVRDMGCPVRDDGQLDWEIVKQWHRNNVLSHRSGSFKSRVRAAEITKQEAPKAANTPAEYQFFHDGVRAGYFMAWEGIRQSIPGLLSEMFPEGDGIEPITALALIDYLLREWFSGWREQYPDEPCDIDWTVFKNAITPADAKRTFTNFQKILAQRSKNI